MVSVLISLISNLCRPLLLVGAVLIISSCSTPKISKSADEESINLNDELNLLSKKVQVVNYGATLKEGTPFTDKTSAYGLDGIQAVTINAVDFNFDGHVDLAILPFYYSRPKFIIFNPAQNKFIPWKHDPLPVDFKASFLLFYDINKDKVIDLIAGVLNQRSEIGKIPLKFFKGSIKKNLLYFEEVPDAFSKSAEPTSSISLIDYDLDGWLDVFVGNWFENKNNVYVPVADRLYRNNKGKFEEQPLILKGEAIKGDNQIYPPNARPTYGSSTCDIDQNGFPDIMTVSSSGHKNKLWMNLIEAQTGERYFQDIGPESNYASDPNGNLIPTGGGRSFFSSCTDYNDDGIMDIFMGELSHAYDNESVDKSSILTGSKETYPPYFIRTEYVSDSTSEAWNQGDRRGVWLDYNIDGRVDLLVDNSGFPPYSRLVLFEQDEVHAFMNVSSQSGIDIVNPAATVTVDLNNDGLPDIITSQSNIRKNDITPRIYVFENNKRVLGRKSVKIHLNGIKANTHAIGAMVMLYTKTPSKKIVQRRWVEYTQGGLASQNEEGMMFGVDSGVEIVGIKVRWPIIEKTGYKSGQALEKLYSLEGFLTKDNIEVTVCEDGKVLNGKMSCQF